MYLIGICEEDQEYRSWSKRLMEAYCQKETMVVKIYEFSDRDSILEFYHSSSEHLDFLFLNTVLEQKTTMGLAKQIKILDEACQIVFWSNHLHDYSKVYAVEHSYHV